MELARQDAQLNSQLAPRRKRVPPQGRVPFDRTALAEFNAKPLTYKQQYLRDQWIQLGYILLRKAVPFAMVLNKKDYGRMQQLLMSAGLAWDKVFKDQPSTVNNLVLNLFSGLPGDKLCQVTGSTPQPAIEVTAHSEQVEAIAETTASDRSASYSSQPSESDSQPIGETGGQATIALGT